MPLKTARKSDTGRILGRADGFPPLAVFLISTLGLRILLYRPTNIADISRLLSWQPIGGNLCQRRQQSIISRQQNITNMRHDITGRPLSTTKQEDTKRRRIMRT